jgi:hypothetical protein
MKILQILVFILGLSIAGFSQNATLSGSIFDSYGALIQFAEIKAKSKDNKEYSSRANENGVYELNLPVGVYTIEFKAINFEPVKLKNYRIINTYGQKMYFDISLNIVGDGTICELVVQSDENSNKKTNKSSKKRKNNK